MENSLYKKHLISINDLRKKELKLILKTAGKFKKCSYPKLLKNKIIAICFFENSTRTRLSFEAAIYKLGASAIGFSNSIGTSIEKGETLSDTISVISQYVDSIVIRHPKEGSARLATSFSNCVPVLNAGDGSNQHPTQTLLDLFSIEETQGRLNNLNIAMLGDLKYGRTVHSLTQALSKFENNRFYFISPEILMMPIHILSMLKKKNIIYSLHNSINDIISELDILYMTRLQKERLDQSEYANLKAQFVLKKVDLLRARRNMKVLHPLPRLEEISHEIDFTRYAYYFQQAGNGIFIRQALLALILRSNLFY